MSLPNTHERIQPHSIYTDRIDIYCELLASRRFDINEYISVARSIEDLRVTGRRNRVELIDDNGYRLGYFTFRRKFPSRIIAAKISLSPLSYLRQTLDTERDNEIARDARATNYLPADAIQEDNRTIWDETNSVFWLAENRVHEILDEIGTSLRTSISFQLNLMTISSLEFCYDVACSCPDDLVQRAGPVFRRQFNALREHYYSGASQTRGTDGDSRMISGHLRAGERYKLYAKTNERCRLELSLNARALARRIRQSDLRIADQHGELLHTTSRSTHVFDNEFANLVRALAPYVAERFQEILDAIAQPPEAGPSVLEFLAQIVWRTRSIDIGREAIQRICRNGSIETAFDRAYVRRLCEDGVLILSCRGRRQVAERYIPALNYIQEHPELLNPFCRRVLI